MEKKEDGVVVDIKKNVCYDWGSCGQCHYFDPNFHGGYCDKHKIDVNSYQSSCSDFWRE